LATSISHNAKGKVLLKALKVAFAKARELGATENAIIFTESRKTQSYLLRLLADSDFSVLFNGSNTRRPLNAHLHSIAGQTHGRIRLRSLALEVSG
jgi:ERCC4-related helicase